MRTLLCMATLALAGCATPPEALRAGEGGLAMTAGLREHIARYDAQQQAILAKQLAQMEDAGEAEGFDNAAGEQLARAAGERRKLQLVAQLREASELSHRDAEQERQRSFTAQQLRERLTAPFATPAVGLDATGKAFAAFASELSDRERARVSFDFARGLYREVKAEKPAEAPPDPTVLASAATP